MSTIYAITDWFSSFIKGFSAFGAWIVSDIQILGYTFTPLSIFGFSSLIILLTLFIVKLAPGL